MQRSLIFYLLAFLVLTTCQRKSGDELINELCNNRNVTKPSPTECVCVPYHLCASTGIINTYGEGIIDIKTSVEGVSQEECENYLEVCCNTKNIIKIEAKKPVPPKFIECGRRNFDGVGFRLTGDFSNIAKFGEFPWMVAVLYQETVEGSDEVTKYKCGGSLIHPQAIITAAHCVSNTTQKYVVRIGEWNIETTEEQYPHEDRYIKSIAIHPQYHPGALFNDIAFVLLKSPVETYITHIGFICLPPQDTVIPAGTKCLATGWGKDKYGKEGKYHRILKKTDLPFVDRDTCQNNLRNTRLGKYFQLDKSFVCAGGTGDNDTCKGDGGGPLVCPIPGQEGYYHQTGIVAWGIGCGNQIPGVYVNVALFRNWINEKAAENNLKTSFYSY